MTFNADNSSETRPCDGLPLTRRELVGGLAGAALASPLASEAVSAETAKGPATSTSKTMERLIELRLRVNQQPVKASVDTRTSLLDFLREGLDLTGAKKGCDHGQCGACTVHLDGQRVASCLTLAAQVQGRSVTTIEGIAPKADELHPMQQAFVDNDALQCGYCTPGQIMAAIACVREGHATSAAEIREYMSGNICRCGAYQGIVEAIQAAAPRIGKA